MCAVIRKILVLQSMNVDFKGGLIFCAVEILN